MNLHRKWIAAIGCIFLAAAVATSQEKKNDPHSRVQVKLEAFNLCDGLPFAGMSSENPVGGEMNSLAMRAENNSGELVSVRTIEGQSRWLPNNAIEVTLTITENDDTKRTETILLEGFEPKTLVLREHPPRGRRELLRLMPVFGPI